MASAREELLGWGSRADLRDVAAAMDALRDQRSGQKQGRGRVGRAAAPWWAQYALPTKELKELLERLKAFRAQCEHEWGQSVTQLDLLRIPQGELFAVQKSVALRQMQRHPRDVVEGLLTASGLVESRRVEPREVFWQRFKTTRKPTGKLVMIAPSVGETGRSYYAHALALNEMGHDVILVDQQWGGSTSGSPRGLDYGFDAARDVASVAAYASTWVVREFGQIPGAELILLGMGLGATAGVLGATTLGDHGRIALDGRPMPRGLKTVVGAPFAPRRGTWIPKMVRMAANREATVRQLSPFTRALSDVHRLQKLITRGEGPLGRVFVVLREDDSLISKGFLTSLREAAGSRYTQRVLRPRDGNSSWPHPSQDPVLGSHLVTAVDEVAKRP